MARFNLTQEKDVEKISKRIRAAYEKFTKRTQGADDCVQEVFARLLEGKHQHSTIDQIVIDYLRANHGDARLPSDSARKNIHRPNLVEPRDMERILHLDHGGESPYRLDIDECARWAFDKTDRAILGLFYRWGLNEIEIGHLFGFSESRVSQRLKRVQSSISAGLKAQRSREASGEMAIVLRPEAERQLWGMGEITFERMETGESFGVASFNEKSF